MKQVAFLITDAQHAALKKRARVLEIKISEQIRRAIDKYLKQEEAGEEEEEQ